MRFTPTTKFLSIAKGSGKLVQWRYFVRKTADLTLALSAGTWIEVTDRILEFPEVSQSGEIDLAQFTADSISVEAFGIAWWKTNIFSYANFLEFKIEGRIGLSASNMATDIAYLFSGLIDAKGMKPVEGEDAITFDVFSYDEYGGRRSAADLVDQIVDADVDGAGTDGLLLQNIPGVFATNANVSTFILKKGVHVLQYEYNSGTPRLCLDGGAWQNTPGSDGILTLVNEAGTQKLTVFVDVSALLGSGTAEQDIIVTTEGETLAHTWFQNVWVFSMLKSLYAKIGLIDYTFDNFNISTYDNRYTTSFYDVPPGAGSFYQRPNTVLYDSTNACLWIGVGDKVYRCTVANNGTAYTAIGQVASGYNVERFFIDRAANDELWGLARNSAGTYKIFCVTISTNAIASWTITGRTGDTISTGPLNFALVPNVGTKGYIFFCDNLSAIFYFDLSTHAEIKAVDIADTPRWSTTGWCGNALQTDYFFQYSSGASYYLGRVYYSGGIWNFQQLNGGSAINAFTEGGYNKIDQYFYFSSGNTLYYFDYSGDSVYTVDANGACTNFEYHDGNLHFLRANKPAYVYDRTVTTITGDAISDIGTPFKLTYDETNERYYALNSRVYALMKWDTEFSMYSDKQLDFEDASVRDAVRRFCIGFNLVSFISSIKRAYVYRRGDGSGAIVTSGNSVTLSTNNTEPFEEETKYSEAYDVVAVVSGDTAYYYDGSTMTAGDYTAFADERVLTIEEDFIPSAIVPDIAYFAYQYFKTARSIYPVTTANVPIFHMEPFDGATLSFASSKDSTNKSGIILQETIMEDGSMKFGVMA